METLAKIVFGSHLYGTNIPGSDNDFRGVYLPSARDCYLGKIVDAMNDPNEDDTQYFSVQKFLRLAAEGQSVALELLFAPREFWVSHDPIWEKIHDMRHIFLTKKMAAFMGYSKAMAGKYSSRIDRLNDVVSIRTTLNHFFADKIVSYSDRLAEVYDLLPVSVNLTKSMNQFSSAEDKRVYTICGREYSVHVSLSHLATACDNIIKEYGTRVKNAQSNQVDYTSIMHAFRVTYQCRSAIARGEMIFPLEEADYLRRMRLGEFNFVAEQLDEKLQDLIADTDALLAGSGLPNQIDFSICEEFIANLYS